MRERELKHDDYIISKGVYTSLPMRERELKQAVTGDIRRRLKSLPMRERELKRDDSQCIGHKELVAPHAGA